MISGTYVLAPHPNDARVYAFSYLAPIRDSRWSFLATVVHSDSNVASVANTNVLGKGTTYGFTAIYALPATETYAHSVSVEIDRKHFDENVSIPGQTGSTAPLTYVPVTLSYNGQLSLKNSQTSFSASVTTNLRGLGSDWGAMGQQALQRNARFRVHGKFDVNHTQRFANDMQANAHVNAQISNSPLVSSEQFAAGGMNSVCAATGRGHGRQRRDRIGRTAQSVAREMARRRGRQPRERMAFHAFFDAAHPGCWAAGADVALQPDECRRRHTVQIMKYASADFEAGWPLKAGVYTRQYSPRFDFYVRLGF